MIHLPLFIVLALLLVLYNIIRFYRKQVIKRKYKCQKIPNAQTSTFLSYLGLEFIVNYNKIQEEGRIHQNMYKQFKDLKTSTLAQTMLFLKVVFTTEPENYRYMSSSANFNNWTIGDRPDAFDPLLGDGIFSSSGESWKHSRIMLRPFLSKDHIKQIEYMEPYVKDVVRLINKYQRDGVVVDMQEIFQYFTIDYATKFLLGESCDTLKGALDEPTSVTIDPELKSRFAKAFDISLKYLMLRVSLGKPLMWLVNPKELREANKIQHDFVRYYINKALAMNEEELNKHSDNGNCFLYEIAKQTKDPKILQDEVMSIILAGRNTTSSLLSFLFFELSRDANKEILKKLVDAVRSNFDSIESITYEKIHNCDYLRWCLYETLRFHPSVPLASKTAAVDTILPKGGGLDNESPVFVPKGRRVVYPLYTANRNSKYFGSDTEVYRPERFADLPKSGGPAFMPFSTGPRLCLGQQLALTEASYITIRLLQTFDVIEKVGDEPYPPRTSSSATMRLMDGAKVRMRTSSSTTPSITPTKTVKC